MNRHRRIELIIKIFLWILVAAVSLLQRSGRFEALPRYMKIIVFIFDISLSIMLIWFMPSSIADRNLKRGLKHLDNDSDKAVRYLKAYLDSEMLTDIERVAGLRILGIAYHKRGDNDKAIQSLEAALEQQEKDNDTKIEILGAIGIVYSESGEYKNAVAYFDKAFSIMFSLSKSYIERNALVQVMETYIKAEEKEKAVSIYDRLMLIRGFKRNKKVEMLLGIE